MWVFPVALLWLLAAALAPLALGGPLPALNFGTGSSTSRLPEEEIEALTRAWLSVGDGVDTAFDYRDERQVGRAVRASGRARDSVFLTTKVPCDGYKLASERADFNIKQLGLGGVDLLLIHFACNNRDQLNGTWAALEEQVDKSLSQQIGVSNFKARDIEELLFLIETSPTKRVKPVVNQIYGHVGCMPDPALFHLCQKNDIRLEFYSPLAKGAVLKNHVVQDIALELKRSPAQVALQYLLQKGVSAVFTTSKVKWMRENAAILSKEKFHIDKDQMRRLDMISVACNRTRRSEYADQ